MRLIKWIGGNRECLYHLAHCLDLRFNYHLKACQIRDNPFVAVAWLLYLLLPDVFHHADPDHTRDPPWDEL
jgi:hypothetical protein